MNLCLGIHTQIGVPYNTDCNVSVTRKYKRKTIIDMVKCFNLFLHMFYLSILNVFVQLTIFLEVNVSYKDSLCLFKFYQLKNYSKLKPYYRRSYVYNRFLKFYVEQLHYRKKNPLHKQSRVERIYFSQNQIYRSHKLL